MIILLTVLAVLLVAQTIYLLHYKAQVRDIGNQLHFIMQNGSFKQVDAQLRSREMMTLIRGCNRLLDQQKKADRQYTRKNEEINATIVSLSHDIRTPLTALDGYLQLARQAEEFSDKDRYMAQAKSRIGQLSKLIDELFLYTKLQNPEYLIEQEPLDILALLQHNLFAFFDDFSRQGTEPELRLPDSSVRVNGNIHAVDRVLANILSNYFAHGTGSLSVVCEEEAERVRICFANRLRKGERVDTERVFNRFYKEDASRGVRSSGLGLSIVKSLMENMHGHAEADSEQGMFVIRLIFVKARKE
ncbi:sensor histidine kinase [Saccharibacillus endophyticus]|uniref:histidine kinase n=1 Tax=Saccharibacillus endophyticus TaxID=2060666 RepID=A0ABQ2A4X0_9BACL|nr:HAMP domain-containing sensor histidine kinase [Saccharibacillus endophyticus]GGH84513.1 histidine kinase [Saccharibacillus endophyticus]